MRIVNIPALRSVFEGSSLLGAGICLTCIFALTAASDLSLHASQWAPQTSAQDAAPGAGDLGDGARLEPHATQAAARLLLDSGHPPALGSPHAPVTIVEFADFECSYCKQMSDLLEKQLLPVEDGKVRIVYRYFPLPQHPWARSAAQMAACVQSQDGHAFWKLHDFLYANQDEFSAASIRPQVEAFLAKQTGVNARIFEDCIESQPAGDQVKDDMQMAIDLGVHATPALFVNGRELHGVHEVQQLEDAVSAVLKDQGLAKQDE